MSEKQTVIKFFVASPQDVAEEREVFEDVVRELNNTWADTFDIRLDVVRWETRTTPGFGEDPQDVINKQISDSYDIFIGIMWTRFGTPTPRAGSGTEEEFLRAYDRYKEDPSSVEIMFYFKTKPISPVDLDPDQLKAISEFRSQLKERGGFYSEFGSIEEFRNSITRHLSTTVQKWKKKIDDKPIGESITAQRENADATEDNPIEEEEEGLIDLIESANDSMSKVVEVLERMSEATKDLSIKFHQRTEEGNQLSASGKNQNLKAAKRIIANVARDCDDYVVRMKAEIPLYSQLFTRTMTSFSRAATITSSFDINNSDDLQGTLDSIATLRSSITESQGNMKNFQKAIEEMPRMTTDLNRARRKAAAMLDELDIELHASERQTRDVENLLSELIKQRKSH
ncbi:MAG: DUF4062 domain-containing protein [Nitrospira sp.]|nr:DUF4062 domain-containing protein [Nitrospira sp.]